MTEDRIRERPADARQTAAAAGKLAGLGAAALILSLLFVPLPPQLNTPVVRYAFDFTHAPLFAGVFLSVRRLLQQFRAVRPDPSALALSAVAAGLTELLQGLGPREPSWGDFTLNLLGAAMAWTGVRYWPRRGLLRAAHAAGILLFVVAAVLLITRQAGISRQFAAMMPLLAGFEHAWELDRWHAKEGTGMARVPAAGKRGEWALEVRCSTAVPYPGVAMEDFVADWRPYRWLEWRVRLEAPPPIDLVVRIDDDQGARFGTRYQASIRIEPARSVYRIDLRDVAARFPEHPMNMARITELHFFLDEPAAPRTFWLDELRLVAEVPGSERSR